MQKYTISTDERKTSPNQSEVILENNDISMENKNNISFNINSELYNSEIDKNKSYIENKSDFPRKSKTKFIRSNKALRRRIIGYEKRQAIEDKDYDKNIIDNDKDNSS